MRQALSNMRDRFAPFILVLALGLSFSYRVTTESVSAAGVRSLLGEASSGSAGQLSAEDLVVVYPTHSKRLKLVHATRAARCALGWHHGPHVWTGKRRVHCLLESGSLCAPCTLMRCTARQGIRTVIVVENATVAAALNAQPDAAKYREIYVPWGDATDGEGRPVVGHALLRGGPRWAMAPLQVALGARRMVQRTQAKSPRCSRFLIVDGRL